MSKPSGRWPKHRLTDEQRDLVAKNLGIAGKVATRLRKPSDENDLDEILSIGFEALCRAAIHFDPKVAKFSTYGWWSVQGNIKRHRRDEVTGNRSILANAVQIDPDGDGQEVPGGEWLGHEDPEPDDSGELVREAIDRLPSRERLVIQARFYDGEMLHEIGQRLGVTTARVRQIETRAKKLLREMLEQKGVA
jgi:RNA polymerase sigma factor (sigma-70 family)